jgi:hypothetical protein
MIWAFFWLWKPFTFFYKIYYLFKIKLILKVYENYMFVIENG